MIFNLETKLPACFQNYRGPKFSVYSCNYSWFPLQQRFDNEPTYASTYWNLGVICKCVSFVISIAFAFDQSVWSMVRGSTEKICLCLNLSGGVVSVGSVLRAPWLSTAEYRLWNKYFMYWLMACLQFLFVSNHLRFERRDWSTNRVQAKIVSMALHDRDSVTKMAIISHGDRWEHVNRFSWRVGTMSRSLDRHSVPCYLLIQTVSLQRRSRAFALCLSAAQFGPTHTTPVYQWVRTMDPGPKYAL